MEYLGQFRQPISLEAFSSLFVEKKIETIFGRKHLVNDSKGGDHFRMCSALSHIYFFGEIKVSTNSVFGEFNESNLMLSLVIVISRLM